MRILIASILLLVATVGGQAQEKTKVTDLQTNFPPIPTVRMYQEVLVFRGEVERQIEAVMPRVADPVAVSGLIDTLVARWEWYGDYMDREHGDFPNMSRERPYWLITTDEAADTLVDRLGPVLNAYVAANPDEKLGKARIAWEMNSDSLRVPVNRIFGFQVVDLARRGVILRNLLAESMPDDLPELHDAFIRFVWDLIEFHRQLHSTWFDRHSMTVAREDWIVYRMRSICEDPDWQLLLSFTAIGVSKDDLDPMNDKFMHRLVLFDPACAETVDFVVPLRHYRLMEQELGKRTEEERLRLFERYQQEAIERGKRERGIDR